MNALKDIWRGLVQRRLWPVAALLLAAIVAVPVALARDPEPIATPAPAPATEEAALKTVVSAADPAQREERRHVVGPANDPFKPAAGAKAKSDASSGAAAATASASAAATTSTSGATIVTTPVTGTSGSTPTITPSAPSAPSARPALPAPTGTTTHSGPTTNTEKEDAPAQPKRYAVYSVDVRFGPADADEQPEVRTLPRLAQLPNAKDPVALFLGVLKDKATAVFLVNPRSKSTGTGSCRPSKDDCQRVQLRTGEVEHFEVMDATGAVKTYDLELVAVRKTVVEEVSATTSSARVAKLDLGRWMRQAAAYDHVTKTGLLARVAPDALEAKLARIASAIGF